MATGILNQVYQQSPTVSVRSSSVDRRDALEAIDINIKPEKNLSLRLQAVQINYNSSPDTFPEHVATFLS